MSIESDASSHQGGAVHASIRRLLDDAGVTYRSVHHEPTFTSEQSAAARGESIQVGGKALLMKVGDTFRLFVISAALKADSGAIRRRFGEKKSRFATREELAELTGLVPGSVPPFGRPILPFDLFVDTSIPANDRIAFNAGSLTDSLVVPMADYLRVARPEVFAFAEGA
ncbi:MAG: hypothetical protein KDA33_14500 [Phycisphaerales bacterium]|nr:hypothetical protein [Phycisphaerales bacterium]